MRKAHVFFVIAVSLALICAPAFAKKHKGLTRALKADKNKFLRLAQKTKPKPGAGKIMPGAKPGAGKIMPGAKPGVAMKKPKPKPGAGKIMPGAKPGAAMTKPKPKPKPKAQGR